MSMIRSKNTKPELIVRKYLFTNGFRYRIHNKNLPGNPDITLKKYKTVIFVNGCFWHGHNGNPCFKPPKSNQSYWNLKIQNNKNRDLKNYELLLSRGWNVIIIWECELKKEKLKQTLKSVISKLKHNTNY